MKILLVEDEQRLAAVVKDGLRAEGFEADLAEDLRRAGARIGAWHGRLALSPDAPVPAGPGGPCVPCLPWGPAVITSTTRVSLTTGVAAAPMPTVSISSRRSIFWPSARCRPSI